MTGVSHQMIALVTAFFVLTLYPVSLGPVVAVLAIIAVMSGALTPDLDQPTATIWRRMLGANAVGNVFEVFSGGHRHMTHSLVGIILIGAGLRWLIDHALQPHLATSAYMVWKAFLIGYISHPLADTITDRGVPWFWPLKFSLKFPPGPEEVRITTNSFMEQIVVRGAVLLIAGALLYNHWPVLVQLFQSP